MNPTCRKLLFAAITLCAFAVPAKAELAARSKIGFDIQGYKTNFYSNFGWLAGLRYAKFLGDSQVYVGLAGYYGTPQGNGISDEYVTVGGITMGYEHSFSRRFLGEMSLNLGYGEGKIRPIGIENQSFFVVEPGLAAGFRLGEGWKLLFSAHYLHMNHAKDLSGFSCGFRFEFKFSTQTKPLNE